MEDPEILPPNPHVKPIIHSKILENLKKRVFEAANSGPKRVLTPSQIALLQHRLLHAFPSFHLPTHPPYAAMIQNAVQDLISEHGVSDEAAISEYIKKNYSGLPWAHKRYLSHHLKKLCDGGELLWDHSDGNYIPPGKRMLGYRRRSPGKRQLQRKRKNVVEDGVVAGEELVEVIDIQIGIQEDENQPIAVRRGKRRPCSTVIDEEEDEVGEAVVVEGGNVVDTGIHVEDHDLVQTVRESIEEQQAVGCEGDSDQTARCENEAKLGIGLLEHGRCEVKSELENVFVSSTIVDRGGEVTRDALQSGDGNSGANLIIVPYEGAKESDMDRDVYCNNSVALQLASVVDDTLAPVSNVENDIPGRMITDAVLKGNKHDHYDSKLITVPFEGDTQNLAAVRPSKWFLRFTDVPIVCGLACQSLDPSKMNHKRKKQKQKQEVSPRRCRSKVPQVKAKLLAE